MAVDDHARQVADDFIAALKAGTAPWQKPWAPGELRDAMNPTTGKPYRGINQWWLTLQGRSDPRWMTYKQALAINGQVQKGEKGTSVEYWRWTDEQTVKDERGRIVKDAEGQPLTKTVQLERPRVFFSKVFSAEQMEGLEPLPVREPLPEWERHARVEALLSKSPVPINHVEGDRAFYRPSADQITLPLREQFASADLYYATAFHELAHSTGHDSRLKRDLAHPFGSEGYAREELTAEMSSLLLSQKLGLAFDPGNHHSYVASWIKLLEDDPREIFRAAAAAEKAVEWILVLEREQAVEVEQERGQAIEATGLDGAKDKKIEEVSMARDTPDAAEKTTEQASEARPAPTRVTLHVPFNEKDAAKEAGARWDRIEKTWYAPKGTDLAGVQSWLTQRAKEVRIAPEHEFKTALEAYGFEFGKNEAPVMDGAMHRVSVRDDGPGEKSGAYIGYADGHPAGFIQNHRTGKKENWKSDRPVVGVSAEDKARLDREAEARRVEREADLQRKYENAAEGVAKIIDLTEGAPGHNRYLKRKGITAEGVLVMRQPHAMPPGDDDPQRFGGDGHLAIPAYDIDGKVWTVQSIGPDGRKSFPRGARLHGCHNMMGDPSGDGPILFAEGFATAKELHERTGLATAACFNASNLEAVARAYRDRFPDRQLVIAGDNDHARELEVDDQGRPKPNVGKVKAIAAAQAVDGHVMLPDFAGAKGSDWNDLRHERGADEQRRQIEVALAVAVRHDRTNELARAHTERDGPDEGLRRDARREKQLEREGQGKDADRSRGDARDDRRDRPPARAVGLGR